MAGGSSLENKIARALHEDDNRHKVSFAWEDWDKLPHHKKLSYQVQAEQIIRVLKKLVKK